MRAHLGWRVPLLIGLLVSCSAAVAEQGFVTTTFGKDKSCEHAGTMRLDDQVLRFDLSALPAGTQVVRARLRGPVRFGRRHVGTRIAPVGPGAGRSLKAAPPDYLSLDATETVKAWMAKPANGKVARILQKNMDKDYVQHADR